MNLVDRAKNIMISPKTEWDVIAGEQPNTQQILFTYLLPLALIPAIATLLGNLIFMQFHFGFALATGIGMALVSFVVLFFAVLLSAFVVDAFAPSFGSQKNFGRSLQLVTYSVTPALVLGIFNFIPFLGWLFYLVGFGYGIYVMYLGLGPVKQTPEDKKVVYLIISMIVLLVIFWILFWILTLIIMGIVTAIFGFGMMGGFSN
ncbi:MAG TPA: Yip1 family protein [Ignavibacteriaceae bacterium]|nr:Yip1 family protein [Ignavibacteriaceae bacterium]